MLSLFMAIMLGNFDLLDVIKFEGLMIPELFLFILSFLPSKFPTLYIYPASNFHRPLTIAANL